MSVQLEMTRKLGGFCLDVKLNTDQKRIGILGASGSGKSMTLKCIAGIENPDQGRIVIDERVLFDSQSRSRPVPQKRKVGYLFQNYALFPNMNVAQNILCAVKKTKAEKEALLEKMLDRFQLKGLENRLPSELSGGQQQRTALARMMASEPSVILLDEPFSALDVYLKDQLEHELHQMLEDFPGTVIMVSHNRDEIYRFCDALLILDQGKTVCFGKTKELFQNPEYTQAARLTGCKNIAAVQRVDDSSYYAPDWDVIFFSHGNRAEKVDAVGIRAHQLIPVWDEKEGQVLLPVHHWYMEQLPFERKYYFYTSDKCRTPICWFVQKDLWPILDEKGFPAGFQIREEDLLLLKDE